MKKLIVKHMAGMIITGALVLTAGIGVFAAPANGAGAGNAAGEMPAMSENGADVKGQGAEQPQEMPQDETGKEPAAKEQPNPSDWIPAGISVEEVTERIEAVDDDTLKETLLGLLDTYTDALDAIQAAIDGGETDEDTLEGLKNTVLSAQEALLAALKDAGIEEPLPADSTSENAVKVTEKPAADASPAVSSNEAKAASSNKIQAAASSGTKKAKVFFNNVKNWLSNLFN